MATISTIDDVSNIRSISAAVTANPGAIAIQNINGALKQVDDQGVVTSLGGGAGTVHTSGSITGDGSIGSPVASSKLDALFVLKAGTSLPDADVTIQPGTDKASAYVCSTPRTGNHTCTLGTTSVPTDLVVYITRTDTAAFTEAIINGGVNGGTLRTFAASPTEDQFAAFLYNGSDWIEIGFGYVTT